MQIKLFNDLLTTRYQTLVRNIKSKSNSFYDSYLDLLEATIKYYLEEQEIIYDNSKTCGFIVKDESVVSFLLQDLKLDNYTFNKLPDYIKKCNDHKHKKEKYVQVEGIINFLTVYFDFVNYYLIFIKGLKIEFNADYFVSIYGESERLNVEYKEEVAKLKEELNELYKSQKMSEMDLEEYKSLLSIKEVELLTLDEQNQILQSQIGKLKDIKLNSLEEKLNKALDLLINLQDEILENRVGMDAVYRSITGSNIKVAIDKIKEKK